jgi:hypothetical protein
MSQVTQPQLKLSDRARQHTKLAIAGLLAFCATVAVVLVLAIGDESSSESAAAPATTEISHPNEGRTAAAVGNQPSGSSESNVASAVGNQPSGPDESQVANAISGQR